MAMYNFKNTKADFSQKERKGKSAYSKEKQKAYSSRILAQLDWVELCHAPSLLNVGKDTLN